MPSHYDEAEMIEPGLPQEEGQFSAVSLEEYLATASPEEIEQLRGIARAEEDRVMESRRRFGALVQGMVDEAVEARDASGIEARWLEDLKQHYGSDWSLIGGSGVVQTALSNAEKASQEPSSGRQRQPRSRIQVNITRPKCNSVMSRLADMLLPTDDRNWGIKPTPNPDLVADTSDHQTVMTMAGKQMQKNDGTPVTLSDVAFAAIAEARSRAEAMERAIEDQLVECNYNAEFRKGLWDMAVLGTMIMRGPVTRMTTKRKWVRDKQTGKWIMEKLEREVPASERVSPWNFYPDPACGGDIRNARYVVEKQEYNRKTLKGLRGQPSFLDAAINECLNESPSTVKARGIRDRRFIAGEYEFADDLIYEVFMVHGEFEKGQLEDAGVEECRCESEDDRLTPVSGCVMICNGRVIKAHLNPLDSGDLPYDVAVYEKIEGQLFGVGVPFVLRNPSRVVIAGWRMAMDNSALSGGLQVVVNKKLVEPADGQWTVSGTKVWQAKDGTEDVQKAFQVHQVDSRVPHIMQVIDRALQFSEDESSMPAIMEGSQRQAPEQVGVANLLNNNANTVMRRLVKEIDDNITDSHITRYYDWNMQYNEDESIKGDYHVDARGTSVLLVRDGQRQILLQIGQFVLHPVLGRFHKRSGFDWLKAVYESNHVDYEGILIDDSEVEGILNQMAEEAKAAQEKPQDPRMAVAQLNAEVKSQELNIDKEENERQRQHDREMLQMKLNVEMMRYANEKNVTIEETRNQMLSLLATQQLKREDRVAKERMQEREIAIKKAHGSGI